MTHGVDGRFAYQAVLGLAWDPSGLLRGLSLTTQYGHFAVQDPQMKHGVRVGRAGSRGAKVETNNHTHALTVGLRYAARSLGTRPGVLS